MSESKDNVIAIHGADLPADQVLRRAQARNFRKVMVIGWLEEPDPDDGKSFWVSSNMGDMPENIYAVTMAKEHLVGIAIGNEQENEGF